MFINKTLRLNDLKTRTCVEAVADLLLQYIICMTVPLNYNNFVNYFLTIINTHGTHITSYFNLRKKNSILTDKD